MSKKKRVDREDEKRRRLYAERRQGVVRRRNVVGMLSFVPLVPSIGCGTGTVLDLLCAALPHDVWLLLWAALFGSFLGLTIRLILERRRFERGTSSGRVAKRRDDRSGEPLVASHRTDR